MDTEAAEFLSLVDNVGTVQIKLKSKMVRSASGPCEIGRFNDANAAVSLDFVEREATPRDLIESPAPSAHIINF